MNAPLDLAMDKATFLAWVQTQERRYDWVRGRAVMQQGGTRQHSTIATRFTVALVNRLDAEIWQVHGTELAVDLGDEYRFPDVMVERAGGEGKALSTEEPVVLIEVLSPSSVVTDISIKPPLYMALVSLEAYVVASQDEARVWAWQREAEAQRRGFPKEPEMVSGLDANLALRALGVDVPLAEIYRGLVPM